VNQSKGSFYDLQAPLIGGGIVDFSQFRGQVLLVVNVASQCGFTKQYQGLVELERRYHERGFRVLAFPSNDFFGQEPGSNLEIKQFCSLNYAVNFPLFEKAPVSGREKQPVFRYLTEDADAKLAGRVLWNFEKFLVDREGNLRARFRSWTSPQSRRLIRKIEELLQPAD
jgi:glutathione peroxidase